GWDVMGSSGVKHALDYITNFQNLDNPVGSHLLVFGHPQEIVDPTASGLSGTYTNPPTSTFAIPPPSVNITVNGKTQPLQSFTDLPSTNGGHPNVMSMWNGTITAMSYASQGSITTDGSSNKFKITFTANGPNVLIAWGGHIASQVDWGIGKSASDINGSPYHSRVVTIDTGLV